MAATPRRVLPEILDDLDPSDPRARHSRRDLRRVHRAMGSVTILRHAIRRLQFAAPPRSIIELGAGDGTLLLRLGRALKPRWNDVDLTLLDRYDLIADETCEGYRRLGWTVSVQTDDVLAWARAPSTVRYDLCVANLFLHHFEAAELEVLLTAAATRCAAFIGCEPRRDLISRIGSFSVGLIGGNAVTREDAVKSVIAGFRDQDLTEVWGHAPREWIVDEFRALPFTHCFTAIRPSARSLGEQP
jgi:hypothetical protein